ncbi:hypothetical protein [uncultured Thiodictyon sp.]|uniref:WD40 repeat domain-containing protein n=1 Tax=uncultured Thiodictyon sp. TaxID=1846217 RepID=UPI0025F92E6D|nr:hypothetical protein [uncultured Thiodictyon sp.]
MTIKADQTVCRWSLETPSQWVWEVGEEPAAVALSPDADLIAVGFAGGALRLYDRASGEVIAATDDAHGNDINRLVFNADGSRLASGSHDGKARLWQVVYESGRATLVSLHCLEGHTDSVHAVAFAPDGRTLATAGYDGRVGLFDVENGEGKLFDAHQGPVLSVIFTPDGRSLVCAGRDDFLVKRWDLSQDPPPGQEVTKAQDMLLWATLSPDGRQLAAVGRGLVVTLHDLGPSPAKPRYLVGHEQTVFRAIYGPDGCQLATVGGDATARLWDVQTDQLLFALRLPAVSQPGIPPMWDFDFRCTPAGDCWIAVPLTMGRLALYRLPYLEPPESIR